MALSLLSWIQPRYYDVITDVSELMRRVSEDAHTASTPHGVPAVQACTCDKWRGNSTKRAGPRSCGTALRDWVEQNLGLTLGIGLGMAPPGDPAWHGFLRLGHMGHVNGHMILGLLGGIEAGLSALDIPHGRGALDAAATVIAKG